MTPATRRRLDLETLPPRRRNGDVIARATEGARVMTVRGVAMRAVSVVSNLLLLALVTPAELGLYAVVFGMSGILAFASDLGVSRTLLRRHHEPSHEEYAALAGLQFTVLAIMLIAGLLVPGVMLGFGALEPRWYPWMMFTMATTFAVPIGTGARVRLERSLQYRRLAITDVINVLVQNVGLVLFALAGRFGPGIFIVFGAMHLVVNTLVFRWAPGPVFSLRFTCLWPSARQSAAYMTAQLVTVVKERVTPVLLANLFGLSIAGLWTFAVRLAQLLNVTFEGFRQAAVPAAALLTGDHESLRKLSSHTLHGSLSLAAPLAAIAFVSLPLLGLLWPQWHDAVGLAQVSVLSFAFAGVAGAALEPVAVAVRGARAAVGEQLATTAVAWAGFFVLLALGSQNIVWVLLPMNLAPVIVLLLMTDSSVRPDWDSRLNRSLLSVVVGLGLYFALRQAHAPAIVVTTAATLAVLLCFRPDRLIVGWQSWRLAQR